MEGIFSSICSLVEHIFGEQYELGVDYLQLLYLRPIQKLPISMISFPYLSGKESAINPGKPLKHSFLFPKN